MRPGRRREMCEIGRLRTTDIRLRKFIFGAEAVELIAAGKYGYMVAYQGSQIGSVKITEAVGRLKTVPPTGGFARTARALGIRLGE